MKRRKKTNKLVLGIFGFLIFAALFSFSVAFGAGSITQEDLEPTVTDWEGNPGVDVQPADPSNVDNEDAKKVIEEMNNGEEKTPSDIVEEIPQPESKEDPEEFPINGTDETTNLDTYDEITEWLDFGPHDDSRTSPGVVEIEVPQAIGRNGEELIIMQVDPKTGEIFLIPLREFDPETGTMKVLFANYGSFMVLGRIPIVDRVCDPDRYPDQEVADSVYSLSQTDFVTAREFLAAFGNFDNNLTIDVDEDGAATFSDEESAAGGHKVYAAEEDEGQTRRVTLNIDDYEGATIMRDVAVQLGVQDFSYHLSTKFKANLYQDLDLANWTRILSYAGVSYNLYDVNRNPKLLADIPPFKLEKCFVYHVDANTGEPSIIYEPTISFDAYDEEIGDKIELNKNQDTDTDTENKQVSFNDLFSHPVFAEMKTVDQNKVAWMDVDDIDEDNTANLNIVITGNGYIGMGPFVLFLPKEEMSLWWIWLVLAVIIAFGIYIFYSSKKKRGKDKEWVNNQ